MPFGWSELGAGPAPHEIEISVFGPGFGECIVIHVGSNEWLIVDSCVDASDPSDARPVAERYLRSIGVKLETQVKLIVASHWHDDHVRGLGRLVELCRNARFSCANALVKQEFIEFIQCTGTGTTATQGAKVREFGQVFRNLRSDDGRPRTRYATGSKILNSWHSQELAHGCAVTVRSLSPSDREFELFLQRLGDDIPAPGKPKRSAASSAPNLVSVVLHLEFGRTAVLLGADMECHRDNGRGWTAVVDEASTCNATASSLFKVSHHGSTTGHDETMWSTMLLPNPICIVTPFNRLPASKKLPTKGDVDRIRSLGRLFVTGGIEGVGHSKGRDASVVRSLKENGITLRDLRTPLGLVRMRREAFPNAVWRAETFAPAMEL